MAWEPWKHIIIVNAPNDIEKEEKIDSKKESASELEQNTNKKGDTYGRDWINFT